MAPRKPSSAPPRPRAPRKRATPPAPVEQVADNPISKVVPGGERRASLEAMRDRLALETDDLKWSKHRAECHCVCGMTDPRALVALVKEIRAVVAEIAGLPEVEGKSELDHIASAVADLNQHRRSRARGARAAHP